MTDYISKQPDETIASPYVRFTRSDTQPDSAAARAGDLWYDETDNRLKYFDIGKVRWVSLADTDNSVSLDDDALIGGIKEFTSAIKFAKGGETKATANLTQRASSTKATAYFKFISSAVNNSTITLISANAVSKTYIGKTDGTVTNGTLSGSDVQFNIGTNATQAANNLKEAIDSANGHNAPETAATATFTFGDTEHDDYNDVSIELTTKDGENTVDRLYRLKTDGTTQTDPDLIPASATFTFSAAAVHNSTLQLIDTAGTIVDYICKSTVETVSTGDLSKAYTTIVCTALGTAGGTLVLTSTDGHRVTYVVYSTAGANGDLRPAVAPLVEFTAVAPIDSTIQLQSTDGTTRTYVSKATGSTGDPDSGDAKRITFLQGSNKTDTATNLKTAIEHANGHEGKITVVRSTDTLTLTQATGGSSGNTSIDGSADFIEALTASLAPFTGGGTQVLAGLNAGAFAINLKNAIQHANGHAGRITAAIAADGVTVTLTQVIEGSSGNTTTDPGPGLDGDSSNFLNSTSVVNAPFFTQGGLTVFQQGGSVSESPANLKTAIEGTSGHNGTLLVSVVSNTVTITQLIAGSDGNTGIADQYDFSDSTYPDPPTGFSGGGAYEFNAGSTDIETAANFAEAIKRNHNRELLVTTSGTDGQVTLTQRIADAAGNTTISLPDTYTLYPATASFTFGDTEFDDVNDATITLIDAAGTAKTYKIKNDYTAVASNQEFEAGASASVAAANFKALVEGADGHGVKATAAFTFDSSDYSSIDNAYIQLTDYAGTTKRFVIKADNDAITGTTEFNVGASASDAATNFKAVLESAAGFGTTPTISAVLLGSLVTLTQGSAGSGGNTSVTLSKGLRDWNNICSIVPTGTFTGGDSSIQVEVSASNGSVTLTQSSAGALGNTDIAYSSWSSICSTALADEFSGGGGEAEMTFTFGDTEFDDHNSEIIGLLDETLDTVSYKIKTDSSAVASSQEFNAGASASVAAANLAILINSSDGHNGKLKAIAVGAKITIHQTVSGIEGVTVVPHSSNWDALCDVAPPATFTLKTLNDVCDVNISAAFSGGADAISDRIAVAVNTSPGQVILEQGSVGSAGNTAITVSSTPDFDDSGVIEASPGMPSAFTEGSTVTSDLDNLTVILADVESNSHTLTYDAGTSTSTSTVIGILKINTLVDAALQLHLAINLAKTAGSINMTSVDNLDGTLTLTMDTASSSGNGSKITGTAASSGKISISDFINGLADPTPYAYFDSANERLGVKTITPAVELDVDGAVNITGDLTVGGTTTTVNSTVVTLDDPILVLGGDTAPASDDSKDRGIEFRYFKTSAKTGFMGWDSGTEKFVLLSDTSNASEVITGTAGTLLGNLEGNVTGNTSGTAATVTGAAQTAITSLGALTALAVAGDITISGAGNFIEFVDGTKLDSTSTEVIGIRVDNGASALTTGIKGHRVLPYDCEIVEWTLTSTDTANVDFEIHWCTYANYPTTATAHAHHTYSPALSSANKATSGAIDPAEWTTYQFSAGDILEFTIVNVSTVTNATLSVRIQRTV